MARKNEYWMQSTAEPLVCWMNQASVDQTHPKSYPRILNLRTEMLQASELSTAWKKEEMQMFDSKGNVIRSDKFVKFVLDAEEIREKINRLLGRYRIQPKAVELRLSAHRLFVRWHTSGFQALVPAFGFSAGVQQNLGKAKPLWRCSPFLMPDVSTASSNASNVSNGFLRSLATWDFAALSVSRHTTIRMSLGNIEPPR